MITTDVFSLYNMALVTVEISRLRCSKSCQKAIVNTLLPTSKQRFWLPDSSTSTIPLWQQKQRYGACSKHTMQNYDWFWLVCVWDLFVGKINCKSYSGCNLISNEQIQKLVNSKNSQSYAINWLAQQHGYLHKTVLIIIQLKKNYLANRYPWIMKGCLQ